MNGAVTDRSAWRVILEHPWTMLALSALFTLAVAARTTPPAGLGDTVTVGDFDYTLTRLACKSGRADEVNQVCPGVVAATNRSSDQSHPAGVQVWLVSSEGKRYRATEATRDALNRDINPGDVAFIPVAFTPPDDLLFNRVDIVESSGESASVRVLVGEGLATPVSGARSAPEIRAGRDVRRHASAEGTEARCR